MPLCVGLQSLEAIPARSLRIAPTFGGVRGDKFRQNLRDGRSIVVGCDLGIAGHEKSLSAEDARVIKI